MNIVLPFATLCLLLVAGKYLRVKVIMFQKLYLPASVIGGILGLIILQCLGDYMPAATTAGWNKLPGFLINIVFAALFLGVVIPPLKTIWQKSGPQLAYGQIVAWGQYVVGLGIAMALITPLFKMPGHMGTIIPVGFEGGHGTAGGLKETFVEHGWPEGGDFALTSATTGIVAAIIIGIMLINWAARVGFAKKLRRIEDLPASTIAGVYEVEERPIAGRQTVCADSVDSLALHLAIIGVAVFVGYLVHEGLIWGELQFHTPPVGKKAFFKTFPLFPLCMIGGLIVQIIVTRCSKINPMDHQLMQRLSGTAMDFLVVAAISTINLAVVVRGIIPFTILMVIGILWNVFCVMWLAKRLLPEDSWFERAIAEMGQSMGTTATGLLLLRVVDPEAETDATSAFGYKQLLHEPFMGGGLWTSAAIPLAITKGPFWVFSISVAAIAIWLIVWSIMFRNRQA